MAILNFPEIFSKEKLDLLLCDYKMTDAIIKHKANLSLNMFSFLQTGSKQVHFADTSVGVNSTQSLLIKSGNCLLTELLDNQDIYYCKLLFFSTQKLSIFLEKNHFQSNKIETRDAPYFVIENDVFLKSFITSLSALSNLQNPTIQKILEAKLEELLHYLIYKYKSKFSDFLHSLVAQKTNINFRLTVENNIESNLNLEQIAFLCNMSLSTFKRHFKSEFEENPGKWIQRKRLNKAKELLSKGKLKASDIFLDFGYNSLSNFCTAFKKEFGYGPKEMTFFHK